MRRLIRAAAPLLLAAAAAVAQQPLPNQSISEEARETFQRCRAAIFFHLDPSNEAENRVPRAFAETLLEQMSYIMFETIRNAKAESVADSRMALAFVERSFIDFSKALAKHRSEMEDRETRERALIDCQTFLWPIMRDRMDYTAQWRNAATAPPE